jgi:ABC-2 type transport system ATP-binding protein
MVGLLANGTISSIIASQNLITMRTSGTGLTLLESQLQRLPDIEQTVIFGNQLYITSRDEVKSTLFAFTQQGYEFCQVDQSGRCIYLLDEKRL